ncbi:hypothetical protein O6H91_11G053400 [Diphasiastrum complanatum]|uniref:Uncharacterized protein n=1 Tax=Diphasiastrum complanatum TaxID=34168 RepID=A0ACC2C9K1_DIPCM|nr:hypothetical protein O6H91_11G053400 [Diphasiastrum complanatum]
MARTNYSRTLETNLQNASQHSSHAPGTPEIHVLAVDDSIIDRKVIERLLKTSFYKVTSVDSALRALEVLGIEDGHSPSTANNFEVNMIITDYCMPEMTGYDLLKKVKENAGLKEIPVVIMSSENVPTRIERCLEEGAKEFIIKPVQLEDVKRLGEHIMNAMNKNSGVACSKRKLELEDCQSRKSANRRPHIRGLRVIA